MSTNTLTNIIVAGLIALIVVIFVAGLLWIGSFTCHRYGRITGHEVQFHAPAACYVHTNNGWFTTEQIRGLN